MSVNHWDLNMMHMLSGCEQVSGNGCKSTDLNSVCRREVDGCGSERVLIMVNHHLEIQTFLPAPVTEMNQNPYIQLCSTNSNI